MTTGTKYLRLIAIALTTYTAARSQTPAVPDNPLAATINGENITAKEVDDLIKLQVKNMEQQVDKLRQTTLSRLMDNALLRQAASAEKVTLDEYLRKQVEEVSVSDSEVDQAYSNSLNNFPGMLPSEVRYRIRRTLEDNKRQARLSSLLQTLRSHAQVTNFLLEKPAAARALPLEGTPFTGPADAPVTIVEFSDFQCPFCKSAEPAIRKVLAEFPQQVRFAYKHFPLQQHSNAFVAAKASWCAGRQGEFWKFHERALQDGRKLDSADLESISSEIGLNLPAMNACISSNEASAAVQKDFADGVDAGVSGTPSIFVNNVRIESAADLEKAVKAQLNQPALHAANTTSGVRTIKELENR